MRIYIAGPYSSPDPAQRRQHVEDAMVAGLAVLERGHLPFIPHLTHYFAEWAQAQGVAIPYETYLHWDAAFLEQCEALLYLGRSPGADRELEAAVRLRKPIYSRLSGPPPLDAGPLVSLSGASRHVTEDHT